MTVLVLRCPRILLALLPMRVLRAIYVRAEDRKRFPEVRARLQSATLHRVRRWLPWE